MSQAGSLILVQRPELQAELCALASSLPWAANRGLSFHVAEGDPREAIDLWRSRDVGVPLGFIAADESSALLALASGADEASVIPAEAEALAFFVERLELRARLRAETQRTHERFAHAEKLAALGTLVAGVGHEINNPLSALLLSIEAARRLVLPQLEAAQQLVTATREGRALPEPDLSRVQASFSNERLGRDATRMFEDMNSAADAITSIVRDLRIFARSDAEEPAELVEIDALIDHAIRLVGREVFQHGLLERDFTPELPKLVLPRNRVTQVIMNVLINACHAIREVERPVHRVRISTRADEDYVAIAVSDTGPGISPDCLGRIFDPFFTTRRNELGTGLGLAISRSILRRIGGDLAVESVHGSGATFLCFLPLPSREMLKNAYQRTSVVPREKTAPKRLSSVLLVEDDERVLRGYVRLLHPDYRVIIAQDATDAIGLLESGSSPDAVLMELDLQGSDGRKLLSWLEEHRPHLRESVLLVTAASGKPEYAEFLRDYRGMLLHKPANGADLLQAVEATLTRASSGAVSAE
ncbi:MAG: ATP-binding protein [Myxococcales bacterium]